MLEELGYDPLPRYREPPESPVSTPELAEKYPLILITGGRHQPMYHSEFRQIDSLRKIHPDPITQINPKTASERGINDGDWVWIETLRGRVRQKCQYFEGIDPGVVHSEHGWWFPEEEPPEYGWKKSNLNLLYGDMSYDPDIGAEPLRGVLCRVSKNKDVDKT